MILVNPMKEINTSYLFLSPSLSLFVIKYMHMNVCVFIIYYFSLH